MFCATMQICPVSLPLFPLREILAVQKLTKKVSWRENCDTWPRKVEGGGKYISEITRVSRLCRGLVYTRIESSRMETESSRVETTMSSRVETKSSKQNQSLAGANRVS